MTVRLQRFSLKTLSAPAEFFGCPLELPGSNLIILSGGNAAGKTLFVRVLQSLLDCYHESISSWQGKFDSAQLQFEVGHQSFVIDADFKSGTRIFGILEPDGREILPGPLQDGSVEGTVPPAIWHRLSGQLISQTFLVGDGNLRTELSSPLLAELETISLCPLRVAKETAEAQRQSFFDSPSRESVLSEAQRELDCAEDRLARFVRAQQEMEDNAAERRSLDSKINELAETLHMLQKKQDVASYRRSLEQRLEILLNWLAEVAQERETVETLRVRHVDLLNRFEENYQPFRGVPDNFGDQLAEFVNLQEKMQAISAQLENLRRVRAERESLLAENRDKRNRCEHEKENHILELRERAGRIADIQEQLKSLRRAHNEIQERKELKRQLLRESIGDGTISGRELHQRSQRLRSLHEKRRNLTEQRETHEKKWLALYEKERAQIQSCELGFPGFDDLPADAPERLHKLYALGDEARGAERQMAEAQRRLSEFQRRPHPFAVTSLSFLIASVGFGLGLVLGDWTIGLFLALATSGALLIGFGKRLASSPKKETQRKAELSLLENRWKKILDAKDELERKLKPLAVFPNLPSALKALKEHEVQKKILQGVREELIICEAQAAALPSIEAAESEIAALAATLPEGLQELPADHLAQHAKACLALEAELEQTEMSLREYDPDGEKFLEVARREDELRLLRAHQADEQSRQGQLEKQIAELSRAEGDLEIQLREDAPTALLTVNVQTEQRLKKIQGDFRAHFGVQEPATLWEQWQKVIGLRAELRAVRDELSAHSTLDELQSREQILQAELNPVEAELSQMDGESSSELEGIRSEMERCELEMAQATEKRNRPPVTMEELGFDSQESPEHLSAEVEQRQRAIHELKAQKAELEDSITQIEGEISRRKESLLGEILSAAGSFLDTLTEGRIQKVLRESDEGLRVVDAEGQDSAVDDLSGGLRDLVMLAVRLGMVEKMGPFKPPLVFDDPFSRLDPQHLSRVRELLRTFSEHHQILLLTRDPRFGAWGYTISLSELRPMETNVLPEAVRLGE